MSAKHEFAFYCALNNKFNAGQTATITDIALVNRLTNIVRLKPGEQFVLFDQKQYAHCGLVEATKKIVTVKVVSVAAHAALKPDIEVLLPVLKREDFELALYAMVELGATKIQLVETQKAQRSWSGAKDMERATRIMIAAAEQSKNFILPLLAEPVHLQAAVESLKKPGMVKVFFDPSGSNVLDVVQSLKTQKPQRIVMLVGPEGDLTDQEKSMLADQDFILCALTPTVLRSVQAVQFGLGVFRSVFNN